VAAAGVCFGVLLTALFVELILDPGAGEEAQLLSVLGALLGAGGAFTSWRDLGRGNGRGARDDEILFTSDDKNSPGW